MPVKIEFDATKAVYKITNSFNTMVGMLSGEILNDCNQYCKQDTGALIASSYIHSQLDKGILIWQTPYARRQYYEIRTAYTDMNPNATWRWAEVAKQHHADQWARQAQRLIEMNGGGR